MITPHAAHLYRGSVLEVVSERSVDYALQRLAEHLGPCRLSSLGLGTAAWDLQCDSEHGPLRIRIPCVVDEPDEHGRCRKELPERIAEHAERLLECGLRRHLMPPSRVVRLDGSLPVVVWKVEPDFRPVTFRAGRLELANEKDQAALTSEPAAGRTVEDCARTAAIATELVAALVYHYQPDVAGGSAIVDVVINDGDFLVRAGPNGSFDSRLLAVRQLESSVTPDALLLQLVQLYAYERFRVGGDDLGLPVLTSNPSIAFAGVVRGWRRRANDLGLSVDAAEDEATGWIRQFSRSPFGRAYRPWAEQFLEGRLAPRFGDDLREGQINLASLRQRQHVFELGARLSDRPERAVAAREYEEFVRGVSREIRERSTADGSPRLVANPEHFGSTLIPEAMEELACQTFPSFEEYMDLCLHDPVWGYYGHRVQIGRRGHFDTHPEALSPDYGAWIAERALAAWRDLVAGGELGEGERFTVVEFGAGNGRLARDFLDTVRQRSQEGEVLERGVWQAFAACLEYRIYELSVALGDKQKQLLGTGAVVAPGDARCPQECLRRDFPEGLRGLVLTNEVPDAFGVHKVLLQSGAPALAALVVPRLETGVRASLPEALSEQIAQADRRIRATFDFAPRAEEEFLDQDAFRALMTHLALGSAETRDAVLAGLWFEEAYVRAVAMPALAQHLAENSRERVLAEEASAVMMYVNVHAADFIRGLGSSLAAGFILTIDYGGSTTELVRTIREGRLCFRTYGVPAGPRAPRSNDPYAFPGSQDLTADVDFTDLARAGQTVGLEVIHYGPETDLAGRALPAALSAPASLFAPLLDEAGFYVLVQGTRRSQFFTLEGATPLELD